MKNLKSISRRDTRTKFVFAICSWPVQAAAHTQLRGGEMHSGGGSERGRKVESTTGGGAACSAATLIALVVWAKLDSAVLVA